MSVEDDVLKEKVCGIFHGLGLELSHRDTHTCPQVKNNRTIIKLSNKKDCLQVLRVKK